MKCLCGYEGSRLTHDWIDVELTVTLEDAKGNREIHPILSNYKQYACPKCGTIRIYKT